MAKLAIGADRRLRFGGKGGTKFRKTRKARARFHRSSGDERDFNGHDFVGLQCEIGKNERRVVFGFDVELVMAWRQRKDPEDAFP